MTTPTENKCVGKKDCRNVSRWLVGEKQYCCGQHLPPVLKYAVRPGMTVSVMKLDLDEEPSEA